MKSDTKYFHYPKDIRSSLIMVNILLSVDNTYSQHKSIDSVSIDNCHCKVLIMNKDYPVHNRFGSNSNDKHNKELNLIDNCCFEYENIEKENNSTMYSMLNEMNRKVSIQWKDHLPYRHKSMVKPFHLLRKRHYHQIY